MRCDPGSQENACDSVEPRVIEVPSMSRLSHPPNMWSPCSAYLHSSRCTLSALALTPCGLSMHRSTICSMRRCGSCRSCLNWLNRGLTRWCSCTRSCRTKGWCWLEGVEMAAKPPMTQVVAPSCSSGRCSIQSMNCLRVSRSCCPCMTGTSA